MEATLEQGSIHASHWVTYDAAALSLKDPHAPPPPTQVLQSQPPEQTIEKNSCQFFELPLPTDLLRRGLATRELSVALAQRVKRLSWPGAARVRRR